MTKTLIRILFLASIIGGGFFFSKQKQIVQNSEVVSNLEDKKNQFQGSVKGITDNIGDQTQALTSRGQEVSKHVSNILESYIKPTKTSQNNSNSEVSNSNGEVNNSNSEVSNSSQNENSSESSPSNNQDKPIYEETLDYGRYLYCQQVIKDYDNQHP